MNRVELTEYAVLYFGLTEQCERMGYSLSEEEEYRLDDIAKSIEAANIWDAIRVFIDTAERAGLVISEITNFRNKCRQTCGITVADGAGREIYYIMDEA